LGIRLSGTDWVEGGWDVEASSRLVDDLVAHHGITWVDVSSGGLVGPDGRVRIPVGPAYQAPLAARIRAGLDEATHSEEATHAVGHGTPDAEPTAVVSAVGVIDSGEQAESLLTLGAADAISIGRAALRDPHWAASAAKELHVRAEDNPIAEQFARGGW
jgi:2,4-dienoyl-CoA reductase-like NADH-dependent reductase (Old Yellow Enzyme family)